MTQLSNLDDKVFELLRRAIAPVPGPAAPTVARAIVRHTILNEQQVGELITAYGAGDSIAGLWEQFGIGKYSLYRHLTRAAVSAASSWYTSGAGAGAAAGPAGAGSAAGASAGSEGMQTSYWQG